MKFKVSKKIEDKWTTFGNIKPNKWDKLSLGIRCTAQLKKLIADIPEGEWINFALFDDKDQ